MHKPNDILLSDWQSVAFFFFFFLYEAPQQRNMYSSKQPQKILNKEQKLENQSTLTYSNSDKSVKNASVKQSPKKDDLVSFLFSWNSFIKYNFYQKLI